MNVELELIRELQQQTVGHCRRRRHRRRHSPPFRAALLRSRGLALLRAWAVLLSPVSPLSCCCPTTRRRRRRHINGTPPLLRHAPPLWTACRRLASATYAYWHMWTTARPRCPTTSSHQMASSTPSSRGRSGAAAPPPAGAGRPTACTARLAASFRGCRAALCRRRYTIPRHRPSCAGTWTARMTSRQAQAVPCRTFPHLRAGAPPAGQRCALEQGRLHLPNTTCLPPQYTLPASPIQTTGARHHHEVVLHLTALRARRGHPPRRPQRRDARGAAGAGCAARGGAARRQREAAPGGCGAWQGGGLQHTVSGGASGCCLPAAPRSAPASLHPLP